MSEKGGRPPGPSWKLALVVISLGVVMAIPLVVRAVTSVGASVTAPAHRTPVVLRENLAPGRYVLFERTGTNRQAGPFSATSQGPSTLQPDSVVISGPNGAAVATSFDQANETINRGSAIFTGAVIFDAPVKGVYKIDITAEATEVLLAPSLGQTFRRLGNVFILAIIGGLIGLCGTTLLIVGIVRRGRTKDLHMPTVPSELSNSATPGWYADPAGAKSLRYWDGSRWTEHTTR